MEGGDTVASHARRLSAPPTGTAGRRAHETGETAAETNLRDFADTWASAVATVIFVVNSSPRGGDVVLASWPVTPVCRPNLSDQTTQVPRALWPAR